ncbi:MAG TPA: polysaccharide deacetylase family protein [Mycobacteriales bacterium]|nr:polysaccharide deacetylase family protein [Mycobacteriales bacterium]
MISYARRIQTAVAAVALAALAFVLPGASAQAAPVSPAHGHPGGPCRNGYVGLTYDDGPTVATRQALLTALRSAHLRATFFEIGQNARANPELTRAALRAGMWVGNHTYTHPNLPQIGDPAAFEEIASTQFVLQRVTGRAPTLFRPPFGATSDVVRADVASLDLLEVLWTVDSRDWAGASTPDIIAAAATLQPGGIILMHDWVQNSVDAVPAIASDLASRGLCAGRIAFTPRDISGAGTIFHAVAVEP